MIFPDFNPNKDFDVQIGFSTDDKNKDRLKYVEYEDGLFDVVDFGARGFDESQIEISAIKSEDYPFLAFYLTQQVGKEIPVIDTSDVFARDNNTPTNLDVYVEQVIPKGEEQYSEVGFFEIVLKIRQPTGLAPKREFLLEIDLNAFSVDIQVGDVPSLPPVATEGDTALVLNPRSLYTHTGGTWLESFPLKPYEVDFYVETLNDIVGRIAAGQRAYTTSDRNFWIRNSFNSGWTPQPYPELDKWKPVVNNDPTIGLKNGVLRWSSFSDGQYDGEDFISGFISEKGIRFPTKSAPVDKGHGLEILDGFNVKINNVERFSLTNVEFNFFGAVCTLYVYIEGQGKILERVGLNKTNSFDPGFYQVEVEPFLWLEQDKNVVQTTFGELNENGKQGAPNLYGLWEYAPLIRANDQLEYLKDANGFDTFTIHDVDEFDPVEETTTFRVPRPTVDFVLPDIDADNPTWFTVIGNESRLYTPVSVTYLPGISGIPNGFIEIEIETPQPLDELTPGVTFRCLLFNVLYVIDFVTTEGVSDPLQIYTYTEETDTYELAPSGLFEIVDDHTVRLISNPEFVVVNGDEILFAQFFRGTFLRSDNYEQIHETIAGYYAGIAFQNVNTNANTPTELKVYDYDSAGIAPVAFCRRRNIFADNTQQMEVTPNGSAEVSASLIFNMIYALSNIFTRTAEGLAAFTTTSQTGLAYEPVTREWYNSKDELDDTGIITGVDTTPIDASVTQAGFQFTNSKPAFAFTDFNDTYLPQTNTSKALGNVFTWNLTREIKEQLVGATEVRFLTAFAAYGFGTNANLNRTLGKADNFSTPGQINQLAQAGFYANITTEVWLRHRDNPALDRLVRTIEKTTSSEGQGISNYDAWRNGAALGFTNIYGTYPRNYMFGRFSGFAEGQTIFWGRGGNTRKVHQFANLPKSLGGDDVFYSSDTEDYVSQDFWLLWLCKDAGVVSADIIGQTIANTQDVAREVSGTVVDAVIMDFQGNVYDTNSDIPESLRESSSGLNPSGYGWLATRIFSEDTIDDWVVRGATSVTEENWSFNGSFPANIYTADPFHDAYPEYAYSGRDLFKFDDAVVEELFGADDYKFDEYERLEIVNYLWRTRENNASDSVDDLYKMVQVEFRPHNILSVPGSSRSEYTTETGAGFFEVSREYDSSETYYVQASGRVDQFGNPLNNPRLIAQDQIQNVVPNFQIGFRDSYAEREGWLARSFLQGEKTVRQVLEDLARHTHSVITYDDDGSLVLNSAYIGDYNGFAKAGFDRTNLVSGSKHQVKYRDITNIYTDFSFRFNYNTGKGEIDRELRITLSNDSESLSIQGLEANEGDSEALRNLKDSLRQQLEGRVLEDFQIAKTFYNTGKVNKYEDEYDQYFDNNLPGTTPQGVTTYGINSMFELAWRWIKSFILNSWEISFNVKMDYVLYDVNVQDDNRIRVGDPISYSLPSITGDLTLFGLVKKIKPDYYNGKAEITIYSAIDPFVYATLYDRIWDGRDVDNSDYDANNFVLKPLFRYPFKDPNQDFTYPDGGDTDDPGFDSNDAQFDNDTFADSESPWEPF